jgi:hypothetical protein
LNIKYVPQLIGAGALLIEIAMPAQFMAQQASNLAPHTHASQPAAAVSDPNTLDYTSSWIGNSLPGNGTTPHARQAVPLDADSIYATPDGRVFTNTTWDEGGRVVSIFKDGQLISPLDDTNNSQNWSEGGGDAIAADSKYIYKSNTAGGTNGGQGISVLNVAGLTPAAVNLTGSTTLGKSYAVYGITIANGKIYVTEQDMNVVDVFNQSTLVLIDSIKVPNPVRIAVDSNGGLWISHQDQTPYPNLDGNVISFNADYGLSNVDHFNSSGELINTITLPDKAEVSALWIDNLGFLFVGDEGPDQNIKVYGNILSNPTLVTTLGVKGGVYAGDLDEHGEVGPWRFRGITGIATDAFENLYVSQNGWGMGHGNGHGLQLQSYNIFGQQNWSLDGLEFATLLAVDPKSPSDVYDPYHRFTVDYSRPAGQEATYVADTMNRFLYPQDERITNILNTSQIQYIDGKKFLIAAGQYGVNMEIYRFDDSREGPGKEIAIPCVAFDYGSFANGQDFIVEPLNGEFIWRDLNGDGLMTLNEFEEPTTEGTYQGKPIPDEHRDGGGFYMDTNGDIWSVNYGTHTPPYEPSIHLRRYFFQGFDSFGAPKYDFNHMAIYNVPGDFPELSTVSGAIFKPEDSKGGTLYVSANGVPGESAFNQIARYDNWDKGNRTAKWVTNIPFDPDPNNPWVSTSFDVAGKFIFADFNTPHYTYIYNTEDGSYVGRFTPSNEVGGLLKVGNTDMWQNEHAFELDSGEIIVLREDDEFGKQLMYKWTPPTTLTEIPAPPAPSGFVGTANDKEADFTWKLDPNVLTYTVSRSTASGGPYVPLPSASGIYGVSSTTDTGLSNGTTYYYVLSALTETGSSQTAPVAVTPTPYGTTYEAEDSVLAGPQIFVQACSGCSGGFMVAAVVQGTSMTFKNVSVATAGTYAIRIYEVNGNEPSDWGLPTEPTIDINANRGAEIVSPPLPFTNSNWNVPGYVTVNVTLNAGANTIVLSVPAKAPTGDPCIDRLVVPSSPM